MQQFRPLTIPVENEAELNALMGLIDAGVRQMGAQAAPAAAAWMQKINTSVQVANFLADKNVAPPDGKPPAAPQKEDAPCAG